MSTRWALMSSRPSSNTANRPTGPAPMITTSVLIVSFIVSFRRGRLLLLSFLPVGARRSSRHARDGAPRRGNDGKELGKGLLGGLARCHELGGGFGIERFAALENGHEVLHGAAAVGHGPHVALFHDAFHVLLRRGAYPDGEAGRQEKLKGSRLGDDAAARRHDEGAVLTQDALQRFALRAAERLLAEHLEDLAQRGAAAPLDLAIEFDEGQVEPRRQHAAEGRFAAAAQADQGDAPPAQVAARFA